MFVKTPIITRIVRSLSRHRWAYLFISPALVLFAVFTAYPVLYSVVIAFFSHSPKDTPGAAITPRAASGIVRFYVDSPADGGILIPEHTEVATSDGRVVFRTVKPAVLPAGSEDLLVTVQAAEPGERGNVPAFTITRILSTGVDPRLRCENPFDLVGGGAPRFVGLYHFKKLLFGSERENRLFYRSLKISLIYAVVSVTVSMAIALFLSLLIAQIGKRGEVFFKSAFYLPAVSSEVVIAMIWAWMFVPTKTGLLNGLGMQLTGVLNAVLAFVGRAPIEFSPINWLGDPDLALFSVILPATIGTWGASIIMYLSNMRAIPESIFEAAALDGFKGWRKIRHITLPLITPAIVFNLIMGMIGAMQVFSSIYILTRGGPAHATTTTLFLIYETGFSGDMRLGRASAMAILLFLVILAITLIVNRKFRAEFEFEI